MTSVQVYGLCTGGVHATMAMTSRQRRILGAAERMAQVGLIGNRQSPGGRIARSVARVRRESAYFEVYTPCTPTREIRAICA
jgi:hypothetical protein